MVEAIVEYDYQAAHDDELSISIGDIISNIRKDDGGWWEGELAGRRGLFPDNFVRELKKEVKKEAGQGTQMPSGPKADLSNGSASPGSEPSLRKKGDNIRKRRCMAAFSYLPQNEDELELKIGDVIEVLAEVEEGWWEGYLNGKTGMFPSNFTKEFPVPEDPSTPQEDTRSTRTSAKDSTGSESDGGDSGSVRSDAGSAASGSEIQPKKVRGFGFGDIFKDQPIKLRPRSMDVDSEQEKLTAKKSTPPVATETMKTEPDNKVKAKEYCKVIFQYEAQNEDELSIKEGEIVAIVSKDCADAGWWLGELNGKQGVFPDNFVKLFVPEVEKERPKKPPPPAAPATKQITDKKAELKKVPPERPESLPQRTEEKVGDGESKAGELQKPALPAVPPKKPLPPKNTNSLGRPSSIPQKRPERPERPVAPSILSDSPKSEGSGLTADRSSIDRPNDFEKLNHPTASRPRVTDRRPRSQLFTSTHDTKSSLPPKPSVLSSSSSGSGAQLHPGHPSGASVRPHSPSPESRAKGESGHVTLEELRAQLKELRGTVELMKSQHRQEIKQLVSELDEEKKIRLSLQMEVEHIKKILSK
ncbi:SH3 domain-containing kinase-binding protein 1 isoform X5 [Denticeps clupeoides]|uniref:SH3 domain-containing kinase-binding protein 1 isoform X5 n=1 Tax=Denticeps clupeoides TaxID=299321 RepID=UPI0010A2CCEE|nr:SH3 domain-containing kinase-binding protein 1 isoform X5 [Denticeps clupeoides]